jgi:hypothetical protein
MLAATPFAFSILPTGAARGYAANERLNIALVGCGGRGTWFVDTVPRIGANLVALCDVNEQRASSHWHVGPPMTVQFKDIQIRQF